MRRIFNIFIDTYEGPMDLLVDLIRKNKVDIFDIPIAIITDQFIEYLNKNKSLKLEVSVEFALFASMLLEIKSKTLLPTSTSEKVEEEDPRAELVRQIIAYQEVKAIYEVMMERHEKSKCFITKPAEEWLYEINEPFHLQDVTKEDLVGTFIKLSTAVINQDLVKVEEVVYKDSYTIIEAIDDMKRDLSVNKKFSFQELLYYNSSITVIITKFLALLELIRMNYCTVTLDNGNNIYIKKVGEID